MKLKIQDMIDNNALAPNVNLKPLLNHGGATINTIERDKDWFTNGTISEANFDSFMPTVASLTIRDNPKFVVIFAPHQVFALAKERINEKPKEKFVVKEATTQGFTCFGDAMFRIVSSRNTNKREPKKADHKR